MATAFRSPFWPGVLSPLFSAVLGAGTYLTLTRLSSNPDADYLFRLGAVAFVMLLPPAFALHRAFRGYRDGGLRWTGWMAVSVAVLSLGLVTVPIGGAVRRARQAANLALSGVAAPDFLARDLDGEVHRLSDHRGSVVLVNIWATWCPPCVEEMPSLQRLQDLLGDDGLEVVAVSVDERYSDIPPFVAEHALRFRVLHDLGKRVSRRYEVFQFPETLIIRRDGTLAAHIIGARDWAAPGSLEIFRDLLE